MEPSSSDKLSDDNGDKDGGETTDSLYGGSNRNNQHVRRRMNTLDHPLDYSQPEVPVVSISFAGTTTVW